MAVPPQRFEVQGLSEAARALDRLSREFGPRSARGILNVPLRRAMQPVEDQIEATTPRATGRLAGLTTLRVGVSNKFDRRKNPGVVAAARTGWTWPAGDGTWHQALAIEFGTRYQPEQRILRNALESNVRQSLDIFSNELGTRIEVRSRQLAAAALRGRRRR